jgi:outer membrane protein assembly factor BamB
MRLRLILILSALALLAPTANAQVWVAASAPAEAQSSDPPAEPDPSDPTPKQAPATAATDWLAYGRDAQLTNQSPQPALTPDAARSLQRLWSTKLDGPVIASPLYANGTVFAATENGSVYALDSRDGSVRWQQALGKVKAADCGSWGISSTGAIDLQRGLLYVANADGNLYALDLATGAIAAGYPLALTSRAAFEYVWGGLRLVGSRLYVPFASYCDEPDADGHYADGRLVAVNVNGPSVAAVFDSVPGPFNMGGPWGFGGVSVEPDASALWTALGNSREVDPACDCLVDDAGYGNSVVELDPSTLGVLAAERPGDISKTGDQDFGAAPLLFDIPGCGKFAAANNKDGELYVWRRDALSQGPAFSLGIGTASGWPFVAEPSWSADSRTLYDASTNVVVDGVSKGDGVVALSFDTSCAVHQAWQTVTGSGTQPPPIVLGDVLFAAGGSGGWSALDAKTGSVLWHFDTAMPTLAPPIAADGRIFAGTYGGELDAFGVAG